MPRRWVEFRYQATGAAAGTNYTTANGLGGDIVAGVTVSGSTIYAATLGGVSISTDGGTHWTNYTTTNGLGNNSVLGVAVSGSTICAATLGGVSISTDGGNRWNNYTTVGRGTSAVLGVSVSG
jgi:hypothetical protein